MGASHSKIKRGSKKRKYVSFSMMDESGEVHEIKFDKEMLFSNKEAMKTLDKHGALKKNKMAKLDNITLLGLKKISQYLETEELTFNCSEEAQHTLKAAVEYGMEEVHNLCLEYLIYCLDATNVCQIYEFAEAFDIPELIHACLKIIDSKTHEVIESQGFMELKESNLFDITLRSNLSLRSEFSLLLAVLEWGKREMERKKIVTSDSKISIGIIRRALLNIRYAAMSNRQHHDEGVDEALKYILSNQPQTEGESFQRSIPRHYCEYYIHKLKIFESQQLSLSYGDTFDLRVDVLKGRVFFYGVGLALKVASNVASAAGLHAVLTATNVNTGTERSVRSTFFNVNNDTQLKLKIPLSAKENESVDLKVKIELSGKMSPLERANEVDVFHSSSNEVWMKIQADKSSQKLVKCIFKDILYFF